MASALDSRKACGGRASRQELRRRCATARRRRLSAEVARVLPDGVVHSHVRRERRRVEERLVALVALVYAPAESDEDVARAPRLQASR